MCIMEFNVVRLTITNAHRVGITAAELRLAEKVDLVVDGWVNASSARLGPRHV
jgi:hypothetical protein